MIRFRKTIIAAVAALVIFLATFHLASYPLIWFDEGSHLHVPKALIQFGTYADYSSDGFRYFGPTLGVGPTVLLPVAAAFKIFGVGLLQARLVVVAYLLASVALFYLLATTLLGVRVSAIALLLLLTSHSVALFENGRQVLGEVPGLFFLLAGLWLWFRSWTGKAVGPLIAAGLLFGLATVTKQQYLVMLAPGIVLAGVINWVHYRTVNHRLFLIPLVVCLFCFGAWQATLALYNGAAGAQNAALLTRSAGSAALAMSPHLVKGNLKQILGADAYACMLIPALFYGLVVSWRGGAREQQWATLLALVAANLLWYVVGSIGWIRYAFPGLVIGSLFVARLINDLLVAARREESSSLRMAVVSYLLVAAVSTAAPLAWRIIRPPANTPVMMADYLNRTVPCQALIETWEPEMQFLTGHRYHSPSSSAAIKALRFLWLEGEPLRNDEYIERPDYFLVGRYGRLTGIYADDLGGGRYAKTMTVGDYELFQRRDIAPASESCER